jgi:hypothetical protein
MLLMLAVGLPVAAQSPDTDSPRNGRTVMVFGGDATLPAGEAAEVVLVTGGTATIEGEARTVMVADGHAALEGGLVETLVLIAATASLDATSTVTRDVFTLDSTVSSAEGATIGGSIRDLGPAALTLGIVLAPLAILVWFGIAIATIVAALALAALGARQVRQTTALIRREPLRTFLAGLLGVILVPIAAVLLMVTVVGIPVGLGVLLIVWPALAFLGYLVTAIWVGEWIVRSVRSGPEGQRPYAAAFAGAVVLQLLALVPLVAGVLTLFGFGAVLVQGWRVFRRGGQPTAPAVPVPAPSPA